MTNQTMYRGFKWSTF